MARLTFRQGIVRHGKSPGQSFFLQQNGTFVDLVVSPELTLIAFADGTKDYLITEAVTNIKAWGPFNVPSQNYWLYWNINRVTGIHSQGHTTLEPVYGTTAPTSPTTGQMWFDTTPSVMKMFEYNGAAWVQVLRVLACRYQNNQFFSPVDGVSVETNFEGTQIGAAGLGSRNIGSLAFDSSGNPIVNQDGKFFTTEDVFTTGVPTGASLKVNNILIRAQASENIAAYQVVVFNQYNKMQLASPFDFLDKVYGIVENDVVTNAIGNVITEGVIFNELWDFTDSINNPTMSGDINDPIYITATGELTTDIGLSIPGQVPVGAIVGIQTILFSPGIYGAGTGGAAAADHGTLSGLADDDHLQYFNDTRGDARYYPQTIADLVFAPLLHNHVKADITDFSHMHIEADISDLDKYTQTQVDNLLTAKVDVAGDTMTGALTLPGDPTSPLQAATKQYVDAIAAGIDAKDSVAVATTFDIGGVYNASGGTGGTGEFTNVDITALDGSKDVDYDFNTTNRVLVKDQTDATQNGIYIVTDQAFPTLATLERAPDHDGNPTTEVSPGNYTFVAGGTTHVGTGWVVLAGTATGPNDTLILNTDDMNWAQVSSSTSFTAGNNININPSSVISVKDVIDGGTIDALTWNGHSVIIGGSPSPADDQVLLYNSGSTDWENDYLSFIRNTTNTSNVTINTGTNAVDILSAAGFSVNSTGNANITTSLALNLNSTGNTTITAGTSSILLNNATDITLTSDNVVVNPTIGNGSIVLKSGAFDSVLNTPTLAASTQFTLPADTGTDGFVLATDGAGITTWVPRSPGEEFFCITDADGDTIMAVGYAPGGSPVCADTGNNRIRLKAGDAQTSPVVGGDVVISSGFGNGASSGEIQIYAAGGYSGANSGGDITLRSGYGESNAAGNIQILGGDAYGYGASGGNVNITAGYGPGKAYNTAGDIILTSGDVYYAGYGDAYNTGDIHIRTPYGDYRKTGDIYLTPGDSFTAGYYGYKYGLQGSIKIQKFGPAYGYEMPDLRFYDINSSNYVALKSPNNITGQDVNITLPPNMGLQGQVLSITPVDQGEASVDHGNLAFADQPYDLVGQGFGTLSDGDTILRFNSPRWYTISATGHRGYAVTAPTGSPADAVFELSYSATPGGTIFPLGTLTFAAGSNTATLSGFTEQFMLSDSVLYLECTQASGIADVTITIKARVTIA